MRGEAAQRPPDDGLFDVAGRGQTDLLDQVPVGEVVDEAGEAVARTRTAQQILDDAAEEREFIEQLEVC